MIDYRGLCAALLHLDQKFGIEFMDVYDERRILWSRLLAAAYAKLPPSGIGLLLNVCERREAVSGLREAA